jgi:hypothetical protein
MSRISAAIRSTPTEDGRIILDIHHGHMLSVNRVGSRIIELLEQGWDEARIADEISRASGTAMEVVGPDVHEFVEALRKHHIVEADGSVNRVPQSNS